MTCDGCRHFFYDRTARRDVALLFAGAKRRLEADGRLLAELDALERECSELAEWRCCTFDGIEPCEDGECAVYEAA